MKKIPLILLILSLIFVFAEAQTKSNSKTKKTIVTKTPLPNAVKKATPTPIKTPTPSPTPVPTPSSTIKLAKFEAEILAELNLLRSNPQAYAKHLEDYLKTFDGKYFKTSDGISMESFEGKIPVEEAITVLKTTNPLSEFKTADGLIKASADHLQDLVKNNVTGHRGTSGSLPDQRVSMYGSSPMGVNENITYGTKTARDVVLTMLIDDGNKSRNHRKNLLNPNLKFVGLAAGEIKQAGMSCVLVLTASFIDRKEEK